MTNVTQEHNDEINLADVIKTIWNGKWIIILFVFISTSLGIGYNFTVKENHLYLKFHQIFIQMKILSL